MSECHEADTTHSAVIINSDVDINEIFDQDGLSISSSQSDSKKFEMTVSCTKHKCGSPAPAYKHWTQSERVSSVVNT